MGTDGLVLREAVAADAGECGRICYEAFRSVAEQHGFPPDFPSAEVGAALLGSLIANPGIYGVVAELDGRIVGSNFMDERSTIAGIGPITVDPAVQNAQVGRVLMENVLERRVNVALPACAWSRRRTTTARSACTRSSDSRRASPAWRCRERRSRRRYPGSRCGRRPRTTWPTAPGSVSPSTGTARVVEHDGRITGYTTAMAFLGHSVWSLQRRAESADRLRGGLRRSPASSFPRGTASWYRWCMSRGLRVAFVMNLMTVGLYNEPAGAYLPSVLY